MRNPLLLLIFMAAALTAGAAETDSVTVIRPVTAAYTIEAGSSHIADTYLSPIKYNGWHLGLNYERWQAMKFDPRRWVMQMQFGVSGERALNYAGNAVMWYAGIDFSWAMMRRWKPAKHLTVGVGGKADLNLGCMYLERNGNNPAAAKAAVTIDATAYANYNFKIGRLPVSLTWQPTLPLTGAFFSPDFGELYYEIYLGDRSGLAHCAWFGNYFRLDNKVTADLHFGATSLRLGYSGRIESTKANNIVSNHFSHAFVIGISGEWLSLNPRKPVSRNPRIINALF
jgi:hypothetical protein